MASVLWRPFTGAPYFFACAVLLLALAFCAEGSILPGTVYDARLVLRKDGTTHAWLVHGLWPVTQNPFKKGDITGVAQDDKVRAKIAGGLTFRWPKMSLTVTDFTEPAPTTPPTTPPTPVSSFSFAVDSGTYNALSGAYNAPSSSSVSSHQIGSFYGQVQTGMLKQTILKAMNNAVRSFGAWAKGEIMTRAGVANGETDPNKMYDAELHAVISEPGMQAALAAQWAPRDSTAKFEYPLFVHEWYNHGMFLGLSPQDYYVTALRIHKIFAALCDAPGVPTDVPDAQRKDVHFTGQNKECIIPLEFTTAGLVPFVSPPPAPTSTSTSTSTSTTTSTPATTATTTTTTTTSPTPIGTTAVAGTTTPTTTPPGTPTGGATPSPIVALPGLALKKSSSGSTTSGGAFLSLSGTHAAAASRLVRATGSAMAPNVLAPAPEAFGF